MDYIPFHHGSPFKKPPKRGKGRYRERPGSRIDHTYKQVLDFCRPPKPSIGLTKRVRVSLSKPHPFRRPKSAASIYAHHRSRRTPHPSLLVADESTFNRIGELGHHFDPSHSLREDAVIERLSMTHRSSRDPLCNFELRLRGGTRMYDLGSVRQLQ